MKYDWQLIIQRLNDGGMTLSDMAIHVGLRRVSSLSDIKTGRKGEPKGTSAVQLARLYESKYGPLPVREAAA